MCFFPVRIELRSEQHLLIKSIWLDWKGNKHSGFVRYESGESVCVCTNVCVCEIEGKREKDSVYARDTKDRIKTFFFLLAYTLTESVPSLLHIFTYTHTHVHTRTHTHSLTHIHTFCLSLSLSHTHTHTHRRIRLFMKGWLKNEKRERQLLTKTFCYCYCSL